MAKLRRDFQGSPLSEPPNPSLRPLRVLSSGTLFLTHTLKVPCHPGPSSVVRAHSVEKSRGGSANIILSLLAQFANVDSVLVAPLGGNEEGRAIMRELENEGVSTRYCKIWEHAGVPSAWVLDAGDGNGRSVINHNPLPDITHEDFVSLLGPLLAPENYPQISHPSSPHHIPSSPHNTYAHHQASSTPTLAVPGGAMTPRPSTGSPRPPNALPFLFNPNSPAPFDWLHFEGRSVKTTLSNITGLDGLARERKWRSHCVFSLDVGRKGRQGVEALIPHADIIFLNKHYAEVHSPHYASTPRAFLLSLTSIVPAHALLVAHWGKEGSAVLSLPTKEYFQSSGWVEEKPPPSPSEYDTRSLTAANLGNGRIEGDRTIRSVRSASDFWAGGRSNTPSSSAFTANFMTSDSGHGHFSNSGSSAGHANAHHQHHHSAPFSRGMSRHNAHSSSGQYTSTDYDSHNHTPHHHLHNHHHHHDHHDHHEHDNDHDNDNESQGTEVPSGPGQGGQGEEEELVDEAGAQDAFIAGMIYALSRRICPGLPYTPAWAGEDPYAKSESERGRWRLDECLRFATELAGRKARRKGWVGLADEMTSAGWFEGV